MGHTWREEFGRSPGPPSLTAYDVNRLDDKIQGRRRSEELGEPGFGSRSTEKPGRWQSPKLPRSKYFARHFASSSLLRGEGEKRTGMEQTRRQDYHTEGYESTWQRAWWNTMDAGTLNHPVKGSVNWLWIPMQPSALQFARCVIQICITAYLRNYYLL